MFLYLSAISDIRLSTVSFDNGMSFILLVAGWPNTSLLAAIKECLMRSSPMEYGFLHLAICNHIKSDAVRSEVLVVEAWEIIFFSILIASLLCIKNSVGLLTKLECFCVEMSDKSRWLHSFISQNSSTNDTFRS